jgi:hypothetical protein
MFDFINKYGQLVDSDEVDQLACKFWSRTFNKCWYANPSDRYGVNNSWAEIIGSAIEDLQYNSNYCPEDKKTYYRFAVVNPHGFRTNPRFDANAIAAQIVLNRQRYRCLTNTDDFMKTVEWCKPFIDFLFHLQSMGITMEARGW